MHANPESFRVFSHDRFLVFLCVTAFALWIDPARHQRSRFTLPGRFPHAIQTAACHQVFEIVHELLHVPSFRRHTRKPRAIGWPRIRSSGCQVGTFAENAKIPTRSVRSLRESEQDSEVRGVTLAGRGVPGSCYDPEVLVPELGFPYIIRVSLGRTVPALG